MEGSEFSGVLCFLCQADISQGTYLVKRKQLLGARSKNALNVLDDLCFSNFGEKLSGVMIKEKLNSYICHKCFKRVEDLPELFKKAEHEKNEIIAFIKRHLAPSTGNATGDESGEADRQAMVS